MSTKAELAIIGVGNIGRAIALGLARAGRFEPSRIILTRRRLDRLQDLAEQGFQTTADNVDAVRRVDRVIVAVEPKHFNGVLWEIGPVLEPTRHRLYSVVSGASIGDILLQLGKRDAEPTLTIIRAMPNTAIALRQSMTCLASNSDDREIIDEAISIFDAVGRTMVIAEELMVPATALCACGIAFFLRSVRAATQGGTEIGFHPSDALTMAAQTALGAASLVLQSGSHPEREIDSVTTPRGCTIAGLNQMEHQGFSSAMIRGIVTSAEKAELLYAPQKGTDPSN